MNEFEIIQQYFNASDLAFKHDQVSVGIGDDCCVIDVPAGQQLVMSLDTLVEDVHFPKHASGFDIATRALSVSISDLAAMGATPLGFTLGITLPNANKQWIAEFCQGLALMAKQYNAPLIGGDTTKGPCLIMSVQVHGFVSAGKALMRSGAKQGDKVYVSGDMGDGGGALPFALDQKKPLTNEHYFHKAFYQPLANIEWGKTIAPYASACLDVSDGLLQDANHICKASHVGMHIHSDKIPLSKALREQYGTRQALEYALTGGDDYQLLYTAKQCDKGIYIGDVIEGGQVLLDGEQVSKSGFKHF